MKASHVLISAFTTKKLCFTIRNIYIFLFFIFTVGYILGPCCDADSFDRSVSDSVSQAAKRELERQRQLEWERQRRQELLTQRNREQESIVLLKARKKTLEFELEALVMTYKMVYKLGLIP